MLQVSFLEKFIGEMGLDPHDDKPLFWDADEERIIRAIIIDGDTSWTKIKENTGLPSEALNVKLRGLLSRNIVHKSDHYWVDSGIREMYRRFNVEAAGDVVLRSVREVSVTRVEKEALLGTLVNIDGIRGGCKLLECRQLFLEGHHLGHITERLISRSLKVVRVVNPFVEECTLSESLRSASRGGRQVVLITRPPEAASDCGLPLKEVYHRALREDGITLAYNRDVHAKIVVVDRAAAIVSSMNFFPSSASGVTWEAGIITIDEDVVAFIDKMIHNLLRRPKTVFAL